MVTAVCGEISKDPVDEMQPPKYQSREVGCEYMVTHGVLADYALVAEATAHGWSRVMSGMLALKITVALEGTYAYIPFLKRPTTMLDSPNAIVRTAKVVEIFEEWAYQYQQNRQQIIDGLMVIPKASIVGIRGGDPTTGDGIPGVCSLYAKVFLPPGLSPLTVVREVEEAIKKVGVPAKIDPYAYRPGFVGTGTEALTASIEKAHRTIFGEEVKPVSSTIPSMWRDCNVFNGLGIPSVTYGPGGTSAGTLSKGTTFAVPVDELYGFAKTYALIAADICTRSW